MKENKDIELLDKFAAHTISEQEQAAVDRLIYDSKVLDRIIMESFESDRKVDDAEQVKKKIFDKISGSISKSQKNTRLRRLDIFIRIAAIVAIIVAVSSLFVNSPQSEMIAEKNDLCIEVLKGQKSKLKLPDGTQVFINSDSKLSLGKRFNSSERIVELSGEAYFEVAHDAQRPFKVIANDVVVTALGTEFSVRNYDSQPDANVFLAEGSVVVQTQTQELTMNPGQLMVYVKNTNNVDVRHNIDSRKYLCWMEGMLYIDDQTFEQVTQTLERTYNVKIEFANNSLKRHRFSGWVSNNSLESTLHILGLTTQFSYKYKNGVLVLK